MSFRTAGIHHVTGIASDPQRNLDFYSGILGLRLVKRTVNFDDPTTYHFYFGDEQGTPGSILTFFPWPDARRGRQGGGQVAVTSFSILPELGRILDRAAYQEAGRVRAAGSAVRGRARDRVQGSRGIHGRARRASGRRFAAAAGPAPAFQPNTPSAAFTPSRSGSTPTS